MTYYADSLSAVNGAPTLASTIVNRINTYWIRAMVNNCPVISPIDILAESRATIKLPTLPTFTLPCSEGCINLTSIISGASPAITNPNLNFQFFATENDAEDGLPEKELKGAALEICKATTLWIRGSQKTGSEFGFTKIVIKNANPAVGSFPKAQDKIVCSSDTTITLRMELSGDPPFKVVYRDNGGAIYETVVPTIGLFEQPVSFATTTTYEMVSLEDVNGCAGLTAGKATFTVVEKLAYDSISISCDRQQTTYQVSFNIISGDLNSLKVVGLEADINSTKEHFVSKPIPVGMGYSFTLTDKNNSSMAETQCGEISESYPPPVCTCITKAAEMDKALVEICEDEVATVTILKEGTLAGDDRLFYVLHDSETNVLGNILGVKEDNPSFEYTSNLVLGSTYYISTVITQVGTTGLPFWDIVENPCIGVSVGTPVRFLAKPEITLALAQNAACIEESVELRFDMNGDGPFDVRFFNGTATETLTGIFNGHTIRVKETATTTYTVESIRWSNIDNCEAIVNVAATLDIFPALAYENLNLICDEAGREYVITFEITGGDPTSYALTEGTGNITGNVFTSGGMMHESTYRFAIVDANNCGTPLIISDFGKCDCTADISASISVIQDIGCPGDSDGIVEVKPNNGLAPYSFQWGDGSTGTQLSNLSAGWVQVSMTDGNACEVRDSFLLEEPAPLAIEPKLTSPDCFGDKNGNIIVQAVGGTQPYMYALDGAAFKNAGLYGNLSAQRYTIQIRDSKGCEYEETLDLIEPDELEVSLQGNPKTINFGDSLQVQAVVNQDITTTTWQSSATISCEDCLSPITKPTETARYVVTVTNANGCTASDELLIQVENKKDLFIPTVFSPNGDGVNDFFGLFSGSQVREIKTLKVFNRWGALLYERVNIPITATYDGWDGTETNGQKAPSGIYVYVVEVLFSDGNIDVITGDVALMR